MLTPAEKYLAMLYAPDPESPNDKDRWFIFSIERKWLFPFFSVLVQGQLANSYQVDIFEFTFWSGRDTNYVAAYIEKTMRGEFRKMRNVLEKKRLNNLEDEKYLDLHGEIK